MPHASPQSSAPAFYSAYIHLCIDIDMSQIEADQLDDLFKKYTHYPDEEPEPLGEIGASADVSLMHDRPVSTSRS